MREWDERDRMDAEYDARQEGYEYKADDLGDRAVEPKEYEVTRQETRTPGTGRYKIVHHMPAGDATYYVSYGMKAMYCTCPDAMKRPHRQGKCKHCQAIARLIGKPHLVGLPDPSF